MTEQDPFVERLREECRALRWEPDEVALARVAARIRGRIAPSAVQTLSRWFVPVAAALLVAIATSIATTVVVLGAPPADLVTALDSPRVAEEDYYSVVE